MTSGKKTGVVLLPGDLLSRHDLSAHNALGMHIAKLLGIPFLGAYAKAQHAQEQLYFIPSDTLVGRAKHDALGIQTEDDFFGGLVAEPFMGTKAISHPLVESPTHRPPGWPDAFYRLASSAVLSGFTVFSLADARVAGELLLRTGPIRIKPVRARAGKGQSVADSLDQLIAYLDEADPEELANWGLVVEENLQNVATYSVGHIRIGGATATYCGTQNLTRDNSNQTVYGGSDLLVSRGNYNDLLQRDIPDDIRLAVTQAQLYEKAALDTLPDIMISRRNYDIAQGINSAGKQVSGVLEQSWRIGGASSAEIAALEAFQADGSLQCIRASSIELYGEQAKPPVGAMRLSSDNDEETGCLTKYVRVETYDGR
ncbi:MAG TPA: DUF3182 family protein [Pseudomonas xinjiangensis]|uniref:DUF3182 family protein n=2 Tax=root TaxID=1 RepID=A0A7V1BQT8_9GAMM|nr:DUF3182 family protein [Halopseudomonas xinjiangensis]HEC48450.1 DUF3182 family protein [Halopseudomonas xinjiangensis]